MWSPASRATSTNCTGELAVGVVEWIARGHFHLESGVVRESTRVLPSMTREEPRNRRLGKFITEDRGSDRCQSAAETGIYNLSFRTLELRKTPRNNAASFFNRNNLIGRHVRELIDLTARPGDFERFDFWALAQAEMNPRIAGRHITAAAFGLLELDESFRR